jgi:hypothetical protein
MGRGKPSELNSANVPQIRLRFLENANLVPKYNFTTFQSIYKQSVGAGNSSVGIALGYGLNDRRFGSR